MNSLELPEKFAGVFEPWRFKVFYGGRDGAKSWSIADTLLQLAARKPLRIVCAREFQNSIDESVHFLLEKRIGHYRLPFDIGKYSITNRLGSEFIFKGLSKQDAAAIKSLEGADIVWVEEAQNVSHASWRNLIPTVRKDGSEIWVSFNPDLEDAPTYQRFVVNTPPGTLLVKVNYTDNPWQSKVLAPEREQMRRESPEEFKNVWLGYPKTFSEGAYWRTEMASLERAGRIGDVPHDPSKPVFAIMDLGHAASGKGDPHAIWFVQDGGGTSFNAIDYWEGNNCTLIDVTKDVILGRGYTIAKVIMPHDAERVNSHSGKTDAEILAGFGLKVELLERTKDVNADLNNVRLILPRMRFDAVKTKEGLAALRNHRQAKDVKTGLWKYVHDWTSHGASGFRYFSVGHHLLTFEEVQQPPRRRALAF